MRSVTENFLTSIAGGQAPDIFFTYVTGNVYLNGLDNDPVYVDLCIQQMSYKPEDIESVEVLPDTPVRIVSE